ncbi:ketopantoate hydroxymethyltransferase [Mycena metata]|uniref:3-methyl-2-oxobutanoate hydroxymethyltransferase n=1 Tax=Mycena metata TaxID=1033252 RepID=A0AAD7JRV5_9AGAR|nr:ketopantoate hydroxymethyltransferase [Mycena metata]
MSVRPKESDGVQKGRDKVTIQTLQKLREAKVPISMLTAYDYPTAVSCSSNSSIDITLVGDSSPLIHHASAVARGTTHPLLVADMPFGSYHGSMDDAVNNAVRMVRESQIEAVKLEGGEEIAALVQRLTSIGIPVMAHVGLLPQRHVSLRDINTKALVRAAKVLEEAGAFSAVVEAVPKELGRYITENVTMPTIGIGAGPWTSGQDDAMGTWLGHKAKFVRRFGNLQTAREMGVQGYANTVKDGSFPDPQRESYTMDEAEWTRFLEEMNRA